MGATEGFMRGQIEYLKDRVKELEEANKNLKIGLELAGGMKDIAVDKVINASDRIRELEKENKKLKEIICLYKSDEEEYKNKIEELEDEIRRLYNEASYLGFKF